MEKYYVRLCVLLGLVGSKFEDAARFFWRMGDLEGSGIEREKMIVGERCVGEPKL